jgi:type I restriction enzyme S subunit
LHTLSISKVQTLEMPLAPLPEQERIVEAIESYFTRLDDAVVTLEHVERNLKRYRASVLKAAIEGRLVPTEAELARQESRDYEPASVLLERVLAERRRQWVASGRKRKYQEPAPLDTSNLPGLPEGWCWATLGQLTSMVKDGPHYSPKYVVDGIPFITGGNVRPEGVDFDNAKRIAPELHAELCKRVSPQVGDILYTKGGTTGIARVNTYNFEFNVWVHVAVLRLVGELIPFYIQHALNSPWCYAQAKRFTHGVGNQDLGLTRMINISVPLPPLAEQSRIIAEVDRVQSVIIAQSLTVGSSLRHCGRLRQSILKWAFEGKLADQDPNDEPASALLERIKAERAASQSTKPVGRDRGTDKKKLRA